MGTWLTKVRAKTHGGKIVTSDHRFKQKAEIGQDINRIMDTGKYMSCGASTKWVEKPGDDVLPSVFKSNYESRKFMSRYKVVVIEHRPNSNYQAPTSFARPASSTLAYIVTEQVEYVDTHEEARKLIRRRFNKHNPFTVSAYMEPSTESATVAASTSLVEPNLL